MEKLFDANSEGISREGSHGTRMWGILEKDESQCGGTAFLIAATVGSHPHPTLHFRSNCVDSGADFGNPSRLARRIKDTR